jgi:tetratricopeptide (TPR) repeat protein
MKKNIIFILFLGFTVAVMAADNSKLTEANAEFKSDNYETAASIYEEILKEGESAAVYYNLGNTYYKLGKLGPAILNYERALLRDPGNEDILYNLEMANRQTIDKFEPIGSFFLLKWIDDLSSLYNTNAWAYISIISFIITLLLAGVFVFARVVWMKKTAFFAGIVVLLISIAAFNFSDKQKNRLIAHDYAIIFSPTVTVKGSPDTSGTELFLLHEGAKVKIKRELGDWIEIQSADGNVGWVESSVAEAI